jgi:hypothetical protein
MDMTLHPWQRINVALAHGIKLRGKMKYDCRVSVLAARPDEPVSDTVTVEADNPNLAAQEAAQKIADRLGCQPGFIAPQRSGQTFIACIGKQESLRTGEGLVTHGFSVMITVAPSYLDETCEPRACDHCSATYRGPAVYCSLECALADA